MGVGVRVERGGGCHCRTSPQMQMAVLSGHTCKSFGPKLFIWLFFLSATSVSSVHSCPLSKKKKKRKKENSPPPPSNPHPKLHVPLGDTHIRHDHQQNRGQINPKDTFHPHPFFPRAVHFQKGNRHKGAIQTSSIGGNAEPLSVGVLLLPQRLFLQVHVYFGVCCCLPRRRRLPSIHSSVSLSTT